MTPPAKALEWREPLLFVYPAEIAAVREEAKKAALLTVTIFPIIMLICYVALIFYFRAKGGYKAEVLTEDSGGA